VGITSIGVLNGIVGEAAYSESLSLWLQGRGFHEHAASIAATAAVVTAITFVTIIFGELVPKRIGQLYPEAVARRVARPMQWVARLAWPFVWLLTKTTAAVLSLLRVDTKRSRVVTHAEINANLDEGLDAGVIDAQEHSLVQNVFELDGRPLASLMLPRADVAWLASDAPLQATLSKAAQAGHSWYPVCDGDWTRVQGVVSVSQLLLRQQAAATSAIPAQAGIHSGWKDLIHPVSFVPETLNAMLLLNQFKKKAERMVLVVDEYGEVQGLITLEDILEEIVGQISDEHDGGETAIRLQADGTVNVDGSVPIRDLNRQMNWDLPDEEATTIAGLVIHEAQTIPEPGQTFTFHGYRFEILRKSRNKLTALRVTPVAEGMPGKLNAAGRAKDKAASGGGGGGEADPMSSG
jgi:putative hemolysin